MPEQNGMFGGRNPLYKNDRRTEVDRDPPSSDGGSKPRDHTRPVVQDEPTPLPVPHRRS